MITRLDTSFIFSLVFLWEIKLDVTTMKHQPQSSKRFESFRFVIIIDEISSWMFSFLKYNFRWLIVDESFLSFFSQMSVGLAWSFLFTLKYNIDKWTGRQRNKNEQKSMKKMLNTHAENRRNERKWKWIKQIHNIDSTRYLFNNIWMKKKKTNVLSQFRWLVFKNKCLFIKEKSGKRSTRLGRCRNRLKRIRRRCRTI